MEIPDNLYAAMMEEAERLRNTVAMQNQIIDKLSGAYDDEDVCRKALDDACVVSWIAADLSTVEGAKKAINDLCLFEAKLAIDPETNGGKVLVHDCGTWPGGWSEFNDGYSAGWNDCRKAMLGIYDSAKP